MPVMRVIRSALAGRGRAQVRLSGDSGLRATPKPTCGLRWTCAVLPCPLDRNIRYRRLDHPRRAPKPQPSLVFRTWPKLIARAAAAGTISAPLTVETRGCVASDVPKWPVEHRLGAPVPHFQ